MNNSTKQITKQITKHLTFITLSLLLVCLTSNAQAATGTVALGDMNFTEADAGISGYPDTTIDGEERPGGSTTSRWGRDSSAENTITWTWDAFTAPTLEVGERVNYTYTFKIHTGSTHSSLLFTNILLRNYRLALGDPNSSNFTIITDYDSVSNTLAESDISVDENNNGLIQTTEPSTTMNIDRHTIVFTSSTLANQLRLIAPEGSAGWGSPNGSFAIREIEGSLNANVSQIPEPSTYALILGLGTLGFVVLKRRRN